MKRLWSELVYCIDCYMWPRGQTSRACLQDAARQLKMAELRACVLAAVGARFWLATSMKRLLFTDSRNFSCENTAISPNTRYSKFGRKRARSPLTTARFGALSRLIAYKLVIYLQHTVTLAAKPRQRSRTDETD